MDGVMPTVGTDTVARGDDFERRIVAMGRLSLAPISDVRIYGQVMR
jgi:hypothetical protein